MEAGNHFKNGASSKSQMSRGNILKKKWTGMFLLVILGILAHGCSNEGEYDDIALTNESNKVEITDFKNWLKSQKSAKGFTGKQELDWNNAEITTMRDGESKQVSFEIYKGKNSIGNDSIRELHIAYVKNSFIGGVKVYSFSSDKEYAKTQYYNLSGQILEEGMYYAPKQLHMLVERYSIEGTQVRLKSGNEDPCDSKQLISPATPLYINGLPNSVAYNCHAYVWGTLTPLSPCYDPLHPRWNDYPDITGFTQVNGTPQYGDRWISYGYVSGYGYTAVHSAYVREVVNGKVTKLEAKCGEWGVYIYDPDCSEFALYITSDIKYYR